MKYYCLTDVGLHREKNQDSYCTCFNEAGDFLAIVCDGIGGGKAGDVASGEACKYILNNFKKNSGFDSLKEYENFIQQLINDCNDEIFSLSNKYKEYSGMGTTLSGVLISKHGNLSINIGDSRLYGYADKKEFRLTIDDTLVNDMIANGEITYEESLTHPKRHYLVKALGVWESAIANIHKIKNMDYYLVCSDGLYNYIDNKEMLYIINDVSLSIEEKTNNLLKKALLNGGYDNITIILIDNNE